jgi:transcriptional regulator with XRE-family HTH domain
VTFQTPVELGLRLKEIRKSQGFRQEDVAAYCGISDRTVRNIEQGAAGTKSRFIFTIAQELGLKLFVCGKSKEEHQWIDSFQALGQKIKQVRKQQKIRQEDLAAIVGCQHTILGKIERGDDSVSIATVLGVLKELGLELTDAHNTYKEKDTLT